VDVDAMVEVARTETGPMPHGSRISPDGTRHYSCAMMSDQLFELDTETFEVLRELTLTDGTGGVARPGPDGHHRATTKPTWVQPHPTEPRAYVALNGAAQIVEVDLEKWRVRRRFPCAKGPYNLALTPDGERLVATYKSSQAIGVWDLEKGEELARLASSRRVPHGVVISPDGRWAFVSCEGVGSESGTLDVVDLESLRVVATVELGLQAGGIAFLKTDERERNP
jgi:DNA-binding beta-propeller fold protein YncE